MSIVALDNVGTHSLICTHHVPVLFGVELGRESGRIDQITEHHRELPSFRVGRRWCSRERCSLRGALFLNCRLLWCLNRWRGEFLYACRFARPDETSIIFIDHRMCEKQLVLQVVEVVVIEVEASFQRTIRHTPLTFEQFEDLVED